MRPFPPTTGRQDQMLHCAISLYDPKTTPEQYRRISNVFQVITAHILIDDMAQFRRGGGSPTIDSFWAMRFIRSELGAVAGGRADFYTGVFC